MRKGINNLLAMTAVLPLEGYQAYDVAQSLRENYVEW